MESFPNADGAGIVLAIARRIVENRAYLSDIDGLIGDGDHGVNMAKGFSLTTERLRGEPRTLADSFATLGDVLMTDIGGSMGPLYGVMFSAFADSLKDVKEIDASTFERMLRKGLEEVQSIGDAKVGDKTLIDAYAPALQAFSAATAKRRDIRRRARRPYRRSREGTRQHDRPRRQDRPSQPARRAFAWRARSGRHFLCDHLAVVRRRCKGETRTSESEKSRRVWS